jgi:hypothetical protein
VVIPSGETSIRKYNEEAKVYNIHRDTEIDGKILKLYLFRQNFKKYGKSRINTEL